MAKRVRISLREVRSLEPGGELADVSVPGFVARRRAGAAVSYSVVYRNGDGVQKRFTIGRHGAPWTPDEARDRAREVLTEAARVADPAADKTASRRAATVAELCDLYLADAEAEASKKSRTLRLDRGRIAGHIVPLLGRMKAAPSRLRM